jgi:multidrug efflux system membrane fusion protein
VNAENKATVRDIVLGPSDGAQQSITKGLQSGDLVVLEGVDRLREGRAVSVVSDDPAKAAHSPGGEGAAKGDGAKKPGWRKGGSPKAPSFVEWLCSTEGGIAPK